MQSSGGARSPTAFRTLEGHTMFTPVKLGNTTLPPEVLKADKKSCKRYGPCGVGEQALYLNSFFIDRRYYVALESVRRVFKRVAMSKGGFTGKGPSAPSPIWWWSWTTAARSSATSSTRRTWTFCWPTWHGSARISPATVWRRSAACGRRPSGRPSAISSADSRRHRPPGRHWSRPSAAGGVPGADGEAVHGG